MLGIPKKALPPEQPDETARDWRALRRPDRAQDLYLSTRSLAWLADLPQDLAPRRLAHDHPRIVNRLALCWCDPALASLVLDSLLADRRGGRRGFPEAIQQELRALHDDALHRARLDAANQAGVRAGGRGPDAGGEPPPR